MDAYIRKYKKLREETDSECRRLENIHSGEMVCKPGCTSCCIDFSILPVEFYAIAGEIAGRKPEINTAASEGECLFLTGGMCSIYESRPIICRTHGLPLLGMGEEEWELSHCDLNFTGCKTEFSEANTFPHDRYNSRLFMINTEFVAEFDKVIYGEFDLVPLSKIAQGA